MLTLIIEGTAIVTAAENRPPDLQKLRRRFVAQLMVEKQSVAFRLRGITARG